MSNMTTDQAIRLFMASYHEARADRKLPAEAREAAELFLRGTTVPAPVASYAIAEMRRAAAAGMLP